MVAGSCCLSIRTFRICLSQNWKTTQNQFRWKCLQTKLLILWQVGIDRLLALVKNSNYLENSLITLGLIIRVIHVLGDFNFKDIDWPDRLNKSGSTLSQSEGQILIDIMYDHGLEQMVHFPTREKNTLDLILTTLPGQFKDVHSPDKFSDHGIVSGTFKNFHPPSKETSEKGVSISERWLWIYDKRHTWVCKGKILQWSLGYSFSTGELWFVNFFYSRLGG